MLLSISVEPECPTWPGTGLESTNLVVTQWTNFLYLLATLTFLSALVQRGQPGRTCTWDIKYYALVCSSSVCAI